MSISRRGAVEASINGVGSRHWISREHVRAIERRIEEEGKAKSEVNYRKAIAKMNGYFMLARLFPRVHNNTPLFIRETERDLNESELHILFFSMAAQPVYQEA